MNIKEEEQMFLANKEYTIETLKTLAMYRVRKSDIHHDSCPFCIYEKEKHTEECAILHSRKILKILEIPLLEYHVLFEKRYIGAENKVWQAQNRDVYAFNTIHCEQILKKSANDHGYEIRNIFYADEKEVIE